MSKPKPVESTILLVRHGRTPTTGIELAGRAKGLHLSETGHEEAADTAELITALAQKPTAIYSSPMDRTLETAQAIATRLGLEVEIDDGLIECDYGDWTSMKLKDLYERAEWKSIQQSPSTFRFPNGESFLEMQARIIDATTRLRKAHPGESIVAVSHADPIKAAIASALGTPIDLFQRLHIAPCSVSVVKYSDDNPVVLCVNTLNSLGDL